MNARNSLLAVAGDAILKAANSTRQDPDCHALSGSKPTDGHTRTENDCAQPRLAQRGLLAIAVARLEEGLNVHSGTMRKIYRIVKAMRNRFR